MSDEEMQSFENTVQFTSNDWVRDLIEEAEGQLNSQPDNCSNNEMIIEEQIVENPSFKEAIDMIERLESLVLEEVPEVLFHLNAVKSSLIEKKLSKPLIQRSITDYFKKYAYIEKLVISKLFSSKTSFRFNQYLQY